MIYTKLMMINIYLGDHICHFFSSNALMQHSLREDENRDRIHYACDDQQLLRQPAATVVGKTCKCLCSCL